jgi:hypothetical protein
MNQWLERDLIGLAILVLGIAAVDCSPSVSEQTTWNFCE